MSTQWDPISFTVTVKLLYDETVKEDISAHFSTLILKFLLVFCSSTITMMHGPINIRCTKVFT